MPLILTLDLGRGAGAVIKRGKLDPAALGQAPRQGRGAVLAHAGAAPLRPPGL